MEPVWSYGPILPPSLIDLLDTGICQEESEDEEDVNFDDMIEYLDDDE